MVDVTTLDVYKSKGNFINANRAREDGLLGKWYVISEVYVDGASKFSDDGKILEEKEDKLHVKFNEIDHVLILNKTNFNILVNDFGTESDDWIGEAIKLRIVPQSNGKDGVVIPSRKNLADEGEKPPTKEAMDDKDKIKEAMNKSSAIKTVIDGLTNFGEDVTIKNIVRDLKDSKEKNDISQGELDKALALLK